MFDEFILCRRMLEAQDCGQLDSEQDQAAKSRVLVEAV